MSDANKLVAAYLKQQMEWDMPAPVFSTGFFPSFVVSRVKQRVSPVMSGSPMSTTGPAARPPSDSSSSVLDKLRPVEQLHKMTNGRCVARGTMPRNTPVTAGNKRELLKELYYAVNQCTACHLAATRNRPVFGGGSVDAKVLVVGEAPGAEEDARGLPFVGRAGELLTKMLGAIELDREKDVFITNVLKCRPPQNRNPESGEILQCLFTLKKQIEIIAPRVVLLLGRIAAQTLLDTADSIGRLRQQRFDVMGIPALVTYHPAALLRSTKYKRPAWEDLQKLRQILDEQ